MNRLTTVFQITNKPALIALAEPCEEWACSSCCEQYCEKECAGCPVQEGINKLLEYEDRDEKGCFYCEDGFYRDVLESHCKYNFCPMCGKKLTT